MTETRRIDCPETQRRELIELERTPHGVIVTGCSRFAPTCAMTCGADCARVLDRRDRRDVDDIEPRVLVAHAGGDRALAAIGAALAVHLASDQLTVEMTDLRGGAAPPPADYDAIVIGACIERGQPSRSVVDYIADYRDALATMPSYAFVIGTDRDLRAVCDIPGWSPRARAAFDTSPAANRVADVRRFALEIAEDIPAPELRVAMLPARKRIPTR